MDNNNFVVIMAGGTGTRFWPYSRDAKPKQFLDVLGTGRSLLQMTFDRFKNYIPISNIYIVSNRKYKDVINEQLPELDAHQVLLEPHKRNTAPCIAYAAYKIQKVNPEANLIIAPSDHTIFKEEEFIKVIDRAVQSAARENQLITIGIKPHRPETGYGYIQFIESDQDVKKVKTFTEKPDLDLAKTFIESGDFVWNAGIFVWSVSSIIKSFETLQIDLASQFQKGPYLTSEEDEFIEKAYSQCRNISIDYAIMEKADNVYVVLGDFGWSDLGSWDALHEIKEKDEEYNVINANAILYDSSSNIIHGHKKKLLVISDLTGYLIADFKDVLLVCKKDDAGKFKAFVNDVKASKGKKYI